MLAFHDKPHGRKLGWHVSKCDESHATQGANEMGIWCDCGDARTIV